MPPAICSASFDARNASSEPKTLQAAVSSEKSMPPRSTIPAVTITADVERVALGRERGDLALDHLE